MVRPMVRPTTMSRITTRARTIRRPPRPLFFAGAATAIYAGRTLADRGPVATPISRRPAFRARRAGPADHLTMVLVSRRSLLLFAAMRVICGIPYLFIRVAAHETSPAGLDFRCTVLS